MPPRIVPAPGKRNDPNVAPKVAPIAFAAALPTGSPRARLTPKSSNPPTRGTLFKTGFKNLASPAFLATPIPANSKLSAPNLLRAASLPYL